MKETKLTSEELNVISSNNGLKMYLNGLSTGHDFTPRSSLYNLEGKTEVLAPNEILKRWLSTLEDLSSGNEFETEVFQFDSAQLQKWGPQGGVAPIDELLEDIVYPSFSSTNVPSAFSSDEWAQAKEAIKQQLWHAGCYGLSPVSLRRVVDDMRARDTLESNSGWPLFTRRSKPEVVAQSIQEAEDGRWKTYPAIALFRNYNGKTRLVWMFPMSANLKEGSFFQPLQSVLMKSKMANAEFAPWAGFEKVRSVMTSTMAHNFVVAASDFSSTDAHFKLDTTLEVFDVLQYCFQPRYRAEFKETLLNMHTIPLLIGADKQLTGEHGVSSGSNWTNFIETIFDLILGEYVSIMEAKRLQLPSSRNDMWAEAGIDVYAALYAIGDDMTWFVHHDSFDEQFADRLAEYGQAVGQEIKAEKTTNDPDKVKSLQRLFMRGYLRPDHELRAVYPTIRALKSIVYPERFHSPKGEHPWTKDMEAVRTFMILENCVDHPLFTEFCKFVAKGDPNLEIVAKSSRRKQDWLLRQSKLVPGLNPTYNQEKRDMRLSQFNSVKIIANL